MKPKGLANAGITFDNGTDQPLRFFNVMKKILVMASKYSNPPPCNIAHTHKKMCHALSSS